MADVFDQIFGQPGVRDFLRASVAAGRVTQAYLFTGPAGSNKTQAAYALASAILCEKDGCGTCETCERIARRTADDASGKSVVQGIHPDPSFAGNTDRRYSATASSVLRPITISACALIVSAEFSTAIFTSQAAKSGRSL